MLKLCLAMPSDWVLGRQSSLKIVVTCMKSASWDRSWLRVRMPGMEAPAHLFSLFMTHILAAASFSLPLLVRPRWRQKPGSDISACASCPNLHMPLFWPELRFRVWPKHDISFTFYFQLSTSCLLHFPLLDTVLDCPNIITSCIF